MKLNQDIISALNIINECSSVEESNHISTYESVPQSSAHDRDKRMEELISRLLEYAEMLINFRSDASNYDQAALEEAIRYDIGFDIRNLIEEFKK